MRTRLLRMVMPAYKLKGKVKKKFVDHLLVSKVIKSMGSLAWRHWKDFPGPIQ